MARPILYMSFVLILLKRAGPRGLSLEELLDGSDGGVDYEAALEHLHERGIIYRVGTESRFAVVPDHINDPILNR